MFNLFKFSDHISLQLNGIEYGKIDKRTMQEVNFADNDMVI
jgi:hypothetical protein